MIAAVLSLLLLVTVFIREFPEAEEDKISPGTHVVSQVEAPSIITGHLVITEIHFHIKGITREWALLKKLEMGKGTEFASEEELKFYLRDRQQVLINQRQLAKARIEHSLEEVSPGEYQVRVDIYTEDTWNIIALPYFRYDSNSGLKLSARGRDYNFLGSLEQLRVNFDYEIDEHNVSVGAVDATTSFFFKVLDLDWKLSLGQSFSYDENNQASYSADVDLGIDFPIFSQDFTLTFTQYYNYDSDDEYYDYQYYTSGVSFGTSFKTPVWLPIFGQVKYNPSVFTQIDYFPDKKLSDERRGLDLGFSHSLSTGRVDWVGNFRNGLAASVGNSYTYNLELEDDSRAFSFSLEGHQALDPIGLSARLSGFYNLDSEEDEAASAVRGILDDHMAGDLGIYLNTDVAFKVWTRKPLFEMQIVPFFDVAAVKPYREPLKDTLFKFGGGLEVIGFPLFARSFYARASLGFDIGEVLKTGTIRGGEKREIFIGLGHHY